MKKTIKLFGIIALAAVIGFAMMGCDNPAGGDNTGDNTTTVTTPGGDDTPRTPGDPVAVTGVTLNKTTLNLIVGGTEALTAVFVPANATNKGVTWESSNTATATVANGTVTAVAAGTTTITVKTTDGEKTATCAVTVYPAPESIAISTALAKNWCVVGDTSLDLTGMVVTATYSGVTYTVPHDMLTVTGFNPTIAGTNTITISYGGKSADSFPVTVVSISSVNVDTTETIKVALNEPLDASVLPKLTVTATYSNSQSEPITIALADIRGFSSTTTGVKDLTVNYRGVTSNTFTVTVVAVTGITIASNPSKTRYAIGESIVLTGLTITVNYSDSTNTSATPTSTNISGFSSAAATASQTVTVTYSGHTTTFTVKIYATVTFNPNGGNWSGSTANKTEQTEGDAEITPPADPTRELYGFTGWYTASTGGTKVNFETARFTVNTTVFAQWISNPTVTFNPNGGNWSGSTANQTVRPSWNTAVTPPAKPTHATLAFYGWYTEAEGGERFDFGTSITVSITLYAQWRAGLGNAAAVAAYLAAQPVNTADTPAPLPVQFDLGTMTAAGSGWRQLLDALNTAGKFVDLDLSRCTMTGTEFKPDYNVSTGKDKIVSIALPDVAESIVPNETGILAAFRYFTVLKSFSGTGLKTIANYAFNGISSLTMTELPAGVTTIGGGAFIYCRGLTEITLPAGITVIGDFAFADCTSLLSVTFKGTITSANFSSGSFPGDLRAKYLAADGGPGTYTRPTTGTDGTWTKVTP